MTTAVATVAASSRSTRRSGSMERGESATLSATLRPPVHAQHTTTTMTLSSRTTANDSSRVFTQPSVPSNGKLSPSKANVVSSARVSSARAPPSFPTAAMPQAKPTATTSSGLSATSLPPRASLSASKPLSTALSAPAPASVPAPTTSAPAPTTAAVALASTNPSQPSQQIAAQPLSPKLVKPGRIHAGRTDYTLNEATFTPDDMTEKGREARRFVDSLLASYTLSPELAPWNQSTVPDVTAFEAAAAWDNRHCAKIETDYLVARAKERIECIRSGGDPDRDTKILHDRWNVSCKLEDDQGHRNLVDPLERLNLSKRQPLMYTTPWQREAEFLQSVRVQKRVEESAQASELVRRAIVQQWERREKWNAPADPIVSPSHKPHYRAIQQAVESEYKHDALTEYLEKQQQQQQQQQLQHQQQPPSTLAGQARQRASTAGVVRSSSEGMTVSAGLCGSHANNSTIDSSYSSSSSASTTKPRCATAQAASRSRGSAATTTAAAPTYFPIYAHAGTFDWLADGSEKRWSCCQSKVATSRGCEHIGYRTDKERWVMEQTRTSRHRLESEFQAEERGRRRREEAEHKDRDRRGENVVFSLSHSMHALSIPSSAQQAQAEQQHQEQQQQEDEAQQRQQQQHQQQQQRQRRRMQASAVPASGLSGTGLAEIRQYVHSGAWQRVRMPSGGTDLGDRVPVAAAAARDEDVPPEHKAEDSGDGESESDGLVASAPAFVWAWSCCGNETYESRGCTKRVVAREHRWNLEG